MTRLYLLRHGETDCNLQKRYCGRTDAPLNKTGEAQARRLGERFKDINIEAIYSSGSKRAIQTADIAFAGRRLKTAATPLLRELDFGQWERLTYEEICAKDKEAYSAWLDNPETTAPPRGESLPDVKRRVTFFIKKILTRASSGGIAVVSHSGPIKLMLCGALGIPLEKIWHISVDLASVSVIEYYEGKPHVRLLNDTCHLCPSRGV